MMHLSSLMSIFVVAPVLAQVAPRLGSEIIPLRYHLQAGDTIFYERRVRGVFDSASQAVADPNPGATEQCRLTVLQADGNDRLVLVDRLAVNDDSRPAAGVAIRVDDRGRVRPAGDWRFTDVRDGLLDILPELRSALSSRTDWTSGPDWLGRTWSFQSPVRDAARSGHLRVEFSAERKCAPAAAPVLRGQFWFDLDQGLVSRLESTLVDASGRPRLEAAWTLRLRARNDERWTRDVLQDVEHYLRTARAERRLMTDVFTSPARCEDLLLQAQRGWQAFLKDRAGPDSPVRPLADARRQGLGARADHVRARSHLAGGWLGRQAPSWTLPDLQGGSHSADVLRDRFVMEYLWSADSPESIAGFERLRALEELFQGRLRVVCLNLDADSQRVREVAAQCGAGLVHILAGDTLHDPAITELPVYRLVTRLGTIIRVHAGEWPDMLTDLGKLE